MHTFIWIFLSSIYDIRISVVFFQLFSCGYSIYSQHTLRREKNDEMEVNWLKYDVLCKSWTWCSICACQIKLVQKPICYLSRSITIGILIDGWFLYNRAIQIICILQHTYARTHNCCRGQLNHEVYRFCWK